MEWNQEIKNCDKIIASSRKELQESRKGLQESRKELQESRKELQESQQVIMEIRDKAAVAVANAHEPSERTTALQARSAILTAAFPAVRSDETDTAN
jgi:predicted  nucleic acid-binding Zn-ribbon protein